MVVDMTDICMGAAAVPATKHAACCACKDFANTGVRTCPVSAFGVICLSRAARVGDDDYLCRHQAPQLSFAARTRTHGATTSTTL